MSECNRTISNVETTYVVCMLCNYCLLCCIVHNWGVAVFTSMHSITNTLTKPKGKTEKKIGKKKKGVRVEMLGNLPQALTGKLHADWFSSAKNSGLHSASEMSI